MKLTTFWERIEKGNNTVEETEVLLCSRGSIDYTNGLFMGFFFQFFLLKIVILTCQTS